MDYSALLGLDVDVTIDIASGCVPLADVMGAATGGALELAACAHLMRINGEPYALVDLFEVEGEWQLRVVEILGQAAASDGMPAPQIDRSDLRSKLQQVLRAS